MKPVGRAPPVLSSLDAALRLEVRARPSGGAHPRLGLLEWGWTGASSSGHLVPEDFLEKFPSKGRAREGAARSKPISERDAAELWSRGASSASRDEASGRMPNHTN